MKENFKVDSKICHVVSAIVLALVLCACSSTTPENEQLPQAGLIRAAEINAQLGIAYMNQGKMDVASRKLEKALSQNPGSPNVHSALGVLNERLKDYSTADKHYERSVALVSGDGVGGGRIFNNYARYLCSRKHYDKAREYFTRAYDDKLYGSKEIAFTNAGICEQEQGNSKEAVRLFREALKVQKNYSPALFQLAMVYYEDGVYQLAKAYMDRFLALRSLTSQHAWLALRIEKALGNQTDVSYFSNRLKKEFPDSEETVLLYKMEQESENQ